MTKKLTVISSFPDQGEIHSAATVGVASYTKNLLLAMLEVEPTLEIEVLAEKLPGYTDYQEGRLSVKRIWRRGSFAGLWDLVLAISARRDQKLLLEFEINEFGRAWHTVFFLMGLLLVRLMGADITLVMHQVVGDFRPLEGDTAGSFFKNLAKTLLYGLIKAVSGKIIVFEAELKKYLGGGDQIAVVPHFVAAPETVDKASARAKLGWSSDKKYVLVFGYIAAYKGISELLEIWPETDEYQLVIAGGVNPNHADDELAMAYVSHVQALAAVKGAQLTGFVPEEQMPDYFAGCDGMIFPYRIFMSSSGPLAWAFSYTQPILLSPALRPYAQTADLADALTSNGLTIDDISYDGTTAGLSQALARLHTKAEPLAQLAQTLRTARSREQIAAQTLQVVGINVGEPTSGEQ